MQDGGEGRVEATWTSLYRGRFGRSGNYGRTIEWN